MRRVLMVVGFLVAGCLVFAAGAFAQPGTAPALEATAGWAGFADDATISHAIVGGSARWSITPRLSVGPEIVYMKGPRDDRDLFVTGNVTFDLIRASAPRPGLAVPYLLVGAGFFRHFDRLGDQRLSFASNEGTFTAGGGTRVWLTPRVYVGAEARVGWELHARLAGTVGVQLGR